MTRSSETLSTWHANLCSVTYNHWTLLATHSSDDMSIFPLYQQGCTHLSADTKNISLHSASLSSSITNAYSLWSSLFQTTQMLELIYLNLLLCYKYVLMICYIENVVKQINTFINHSIKMTSFVWGCASWFQSEDLARRCNSSVTEWTF